MCEKGCEKRPGGRGSRRGPRAALGLWSLFSTSAVVQAGEATDGRGDAETTVPPTGPGYTDSAQPGLMRLGLPGLFRPGTWAVSATSGYGFTEAQPTDDGAHHRLTGSVAVAHAPLRGLELSLRLAGRMDRHPRDSQGPDSSYVGEPRLALRYGRARHDGALGGELALRVPGEQAPSLSLGASVFSARALAARFVGAWTFAGMAGLRLDRSAEAKPDLTRTRPGDRLALGLADFNAALLGVGLSRRVGDTDLLLEASADLLWGGGAPSLAQSPMRFGAGVRRTLGRAWQIFALVELSPSRRPGLAPEDPLIPVEPRVAGRIGLAFDFGAAPAPARPPSPPGEAPAGAERHVSAAPEPPFTPNEEAADPPPVPAGQLRGLIRSFKGQGLRATVVVAPLGSEAKTDADGAFALDVPPGVYQVEIAALGYRPQRREVRIEENGVTILNADLRRARGRR